MREAGLAPIRCDRSSAVPWRTTITFGRISVGAINRNKPRRVTRWVSWRHTCRRCAGYPCLWRARRQVRSRAGIGAWVRTIDRSRWISCRWRCRTRRHSRGGGRRRTHKLRAGRLRACRWGRRTHWRASRTYKIRAGWLTRNGSGRQTRCTDRRIGRAALTMGCGVTVTGASGRAPDGAITPRVGRGWSGLAPAGDNFRVRSVTATRGGSPSAPAAGSD